MRAALESQRHRRQPRRELTEQPGLHSALHAVTASSSGNPNPRAQARTVASDAGRRLPRSYLDSAGALMPGTPRPSPDRRRFARAPMATLNHSFHVMLDLLPPL